MNNWNINQRSQRSQHWASTSDTLSFDSPSPGMRSQYDRNNCESNHVEPSIEVPSRIAEKVTSGEAKKNVVPGQIQRSSKGLSADSILKGNSVSWVISPSTQSPTTSEISSPNTKNFDSGVDPYQSSQAVTAAPSSSIDQWREVVDPESERTYYYNRKTRASKWRLPNGAKLMTKASCQPAMLHYEQSTPQQSHTRDEIGMTELRVRYSSNESEPNSNRRAATHPHRNRKDRQPRVRQDSASPQKNRPREESKQKSQGIVYYEKKQQSSSRQKHRSREEFGAPADYNNGHREFDQSDAAGETKPSHSMFPQDWTPDAVFCLYCGLKCESRTIFGSQHLPQCNKFAYIQRHGLSTTHIELERILFRAWSKIGNYSDDCSPDQASSHRLVAGSNDLRYHPLEEEDAITNSRSKNYGAVEMKTCPFCEKALAHGNEFSAHLLKCTVRIRMRKQRRSINKEDIAPPPRRECVTPGRRMPWE